MLRNLFLLALTAAALAPMALVLTGCGRSRAHRCSPRPDGPGPDRVRPVNFPCYTCGKTGPLNMPQPISKRGYAHLCPGCTHWWIRRPELKREQRGEL